MEYRKIIGFGKSSFVVSIPKDWMIKNNIKKGSSVKIYEDDEKLIISPLKDLDLKEEKKSKSLNFENEKQLQRELISAYIEGFDTIIVKGKDLEKKFNVINKLFDNLIALEIVSHDNDKIVAKDYLNLEDISLKSIIVKIDNNIKSMFLDLNELFENKIFDDKVLKEYVDLSVERDKSINKLSFLGFRIIRKLLSSPSKNSFSIMELFRTWSLLVQLEKIGDELKRIFKMLNNSFEKEFFKELYNSYESSFKVFYNDKKLSFRKKNLYINENLRKLRRKVRNKILKEKDFEKTQVYEKMVNITSYLEEILRLSFDFS